MGKITLNEFIGFLNEGHEIEFKFSGRHYLVSYFQVKPFLKKVRVEYCFAPPKESVDDLQKFETIEAML